MSIFGSLNTANRGLSAAQRALDATSQNIVNANTPGYSRQRVLLTSVGQPVTATFHTGNGVVYGGVDVADVSRIRDAFLEATRAAAGGRQSFLESQTDILTSAQQLLSEPGETGLQSTMDSFYASWHDLASNPPDTAAAAVVIQRGLAVTQQVRTVSNGIAAQWTTARDTLADVVNRANQATSDLAKLNEAVTAGQMAGKPVNELLDTRDTLVRSLADLVGATSSLDAEGRLSVSVNGVSILTGNHADPITLIGANDISTSAADPPGLKVGTFLVPVEAGHAAGLLGTLRTDLPSLSDQVDAVATRLRDAVNGVYGQGYASDGSTGNAFFSGTNAKDLAVVPVAGSALAIAAASGKVDGTVAGMVGDLADDQRSATALGGVDGASATWRKLTSSLGVQVQSLKTAQSVQDAVVAAADGAVQSDAGVNLDEEMTNMMLFQRAYQASARAITTADEIMDTLINRTGKVGL